MNPIIPNPIPKGTTMEQWDRYVIDKHNHDAHIANKRAFLKLVLDYVEGFDIEKARVKITAMIDAEASMDAPNEPGYYRANND